MPISSSAGMPPATFVCGDAASAGNSTTWASTRRPADVTSPYEDRVVVRKMDTMWSSFVRSSLVDRDSQASNAAGVERAIVPDAPSITVHGSSSICSAATAAASSPAFLAAAAAATSASADDRVAAAAAAFIAAAFTLSSP